MRKSGLQLANTLSHCHICDIIRFIVSVLARALQRDTVKRR